MRTLLLNRRSSGRDYDQVGGEYIPPEYVPPKLPTALDTVQRVLFGTNPDWFYSNYRVQQYLALLHLTELSEFIFALDPRITYNHRRTDFSRPELYVPVATREHVNIYGDFSTPDLLGNSIRRWRVTTVGPKQVDILRPSLPRMSSTTQLSPDVVVIVTEQIDPLFLSTGFLATAFLGGPADISPEGGFSEPVTLPGEEAFISFQSFSGEAFFVSSYVRPTQSPGEIAAKLQTIRSAFQADLFGLAPVEPVKTFQALWYDHPELAHQLGGLLLAYAWRLEALRRA